MAENIRAKVKIEVGGKEERPGKGHKCQELSWVNGDMIESSWTMFVQAFETADYLAP